MPRRSPLPAQKPLAQGAVLCLDIDGVCSPRGQNLRFHVRAPHPGFVTHMSHPAVHSHPALATWIQELADAFTHLVWLSSWGPDCAAYAMGAGLPFASNWPYLASGDASDRTRPDGRGILPWRKLEAVRQWVAPDQPVTIVDDELVPQRWPYARQADIDRSVEIIRRRPGPILLIAPAKEIGLTREAIDCLCAFARNPHAGRFGGRGVHHLHSGRWIQWPWPLQPSQENPVAVLPDDEEAWENERRELLRDRYRELNGAEPVPKGEVWCNWRD